MTGAAAVDLNALVDGQKMGSKLTGFIILAVLAMMSDGYDLASLGYIQPELLREWGLGKTALAPAFSAGIIGMMIGGPLLGVLGDRYGRKPMVVAGLALIGVLDLVTTTVVGTRELAVLRFFTGLMVGGVFPNVAALIAELTPRRVRGRVLVIVALGVVLGIALPGLVANRLVPSHGWRAILYVGGALMIAVATAVAIIMPESIKYLVGRGGHEDRALRLARTLRPDLRLADGSRLQLPFAGDRGRGGLKPLFGGTLAIVTPMLWLCQASNQMANFFSLTWLPALLQAGGASTSSAGAIAPLFALGGLVAGALLLFVIERLGVVPMVAMFLLGSPLVAYMAANDLSPAVHALVIACAGFCVTGIQIGLTALLGLLYPTPIRSVGTGWTQGAGRVGALAAPVVGGLLLGRLHVAPARLPLAPAALLLVGGVACIVLMLACRRQFGSFRIEEFPLMDEVADIPVDPVGGTI